MENSADGEITGKSQQTYKTVIDEGKLSVFEQAAQRTGYGMNVTARAGEEISVPNRGREGFHTVKVSPGCVEVAVTIPAGQETKDTTPFYDAVRRLEQTPK